MKKTRLLAILFGVTFFATTVLGFIQSPATYADATSYCKSQGYSQGGRNGSDFSACLTGYNGKVDGKTLAQSCPSSLGGSAGQQGSPVAICTTAWNGATAPGQKPPSNTPVAVWKPSVPAQDACTASDSPVAGGDAGSFNACERGYDGANYQKTQDQACSMLVGESKTLGDAAECQAGWDLAKGVPIPGSGSRGTQPNTPSGSACIALGYTDSTSSQYAACTYGYTQEAAGKTEAQACNSTNQPDPNDLAACQKGWEQSQTDAAAVATKQLGCDIQLSSPLSWAICPAVDILSKLISAYDNQITNQLDVKTNAIFCSTKDTCKAYYGAWQSFRNIALGLMTVAGLIIVIAQALGLEILDAYTLRKMLPRLLVAAIGITLSWPLMKFAIQLSDDLGFGIRHLIYAPFSTLSDTGNLSFGNDIASFFFGGGALVKGGIALWIQFGGLGALILFAMTAALGVMVALAVLILRQVLIILMMLLAPIAIIAYVLPNTQRMYRLWWESFSKALLMFPLIAAMIATGRVFSAITFNNGGLFNQLIGFVAYFAPYFMIPATFRLAGTALGGMGNFVNGRARGGFAALSKQRAENSAKRHQMARGRGLYRDAINIKNPFTGKTHNIAPFLNRSGLQTIDAQDYWREKIGTNPWQTRDGVRGGIGKAGEKMFGRQGRSLASRRANERIAHTRKLGEENPLRYHGGRGISGDLQYMYGGLEGQTVRSGEYAGQDAQKVVRDNWTHRDDNGNILYYDDETGTMTADATGKTFHDMAFKAPKGEGEMLALADVLDSGGTDSVSGKAAREAATDLRAYAIGLDSHQGNEETHRGETEFLGKMQAASAGRLENFEIARYYNRLVRSGEMTPGEAKKRLKTLQQMAAQKRPSQAEGYGLGFRTEIGPDGQPVEIAYDVYEDPAGAEAQESIGRISSDDMRPAKSEDFVPDKTNPDQLSGYGEAWVARMANVQTESYKENGVWKVRPIIRNGRQVPKSAAGLRDAASARAKFETIDLYGSGDVGMQAAAMLIMQRAGVTIRPRAGGDVGSGGGGGTPRGGSSTTGGSVTTTTGAAQARQFPLQQPPEPPPPGLGGGGSLPPPPHL